MYRIAIRATSRLRLLALLAVACSTGAMIGGAQASAATGKYEIGVGEGYYNVGRLHLAGQFRSATLAGASAAFGRISSCSLRNRQRNWVRASWRSMRISGDFITYGGIGYIGNGGFDEQANGCTHPAEIRISQLTVTGSRWSTVQGLRIGETVQQMREIYPNATRHPDGWWLAEKYVPYGDGGYVGSLVARTRGGVVVSLRVNVGAEGD